MANVITSIRIICSLSLLFCPTLSIPFYILYIIAGVSDMIDGAIARKTNSTSEFGSKLDTFSDFIMLSICLIKLLPVLNIKPWMYIWMGFITLIKVINIILGYMSQKKIVVVHSIMNKITGGLLFALPLTIKVIDLRYSVAIVCITASCAAIQEWHYIRKGRSET